jgi:serine/threonine-protein kinase
MPATTPCPDPARWADLLDGRLPADEQARLAAHLDECAACQQTVDGLTAGDAGWEAAARALDSQADPDPFLRGAMDDLKGAARPPSPAGDAAPDLGFLDPPARPDQLGRLGPYEVLQVIGRGGMGVVLKAFDPSLNRLVAIKVLAPQWATSGAARQRFAREAEATAAVRHDHVVAIHAVAEVKGLPYLVMEYVPGISLQELLDRTGPLEVRQIVRIGMQTAAGLAAAHARGLIHRDVKPSNILLEAGLQRVKLSDFGLARAVDDASLTQSGVIAGTPQYMAPEQARGAALDHRADLFSLGSVLYALGAGRPPFRAPSTLAVLRRVCEDEPRPLRDVNPEVPAWLEEVVTRLHAKRPDDRFQSADEVSRLLERHLAHLQNPSRVPAPRPPPRPTPRRRRLLLAAALGSLLAVPMLCLCGGLLLPLVPLAPAAGTQVVLSNGRASRIGARFTFAVDYRLPSGVPPGVGQYVWVVRSGRGTLSERTLAPAELNGAGTLQGSAIVPGAFVDGPLETYVEAAELVPGQLGWQRRRISNVVMLLP